MFAVVLLVCGITGSPSPFIVDGCGLVIGKTPHPTENICLDRKGVIFEGIKSNLPPGAFIADSKCFRLDKST